jgi:glycosyltransferase involved in cell wall biosynthesis
LAPEPLVSVIVANYNYASYLSDAIESVFKQTYSNWELIICDDGSTDESVEIARRFELRDPRVRVLVKENGGQVSAWNAAYPHCEGEVFCFLDSDDAFDSRKLESIIFAFRRESEVGLVYHRFRYVDDQMNPLDLYGPDEFPSGWLADAALASGQGFVSKTSDFAIRREVLELFTPLPEELAFADGYICRLATFVTRIGCIPETLSYYRIHGSNAMGNLTLLDKRTLVPLIDLLRSSYMLEDEFLRSNVVMELEANERLENLAYYWRAVGALFILEGKPDHGVKDHTKEEILRILSDVSQRRVWKSLFALPGFISIRLLELWWSDGWWKPFARPIAGFLDLREKRN